MKRNLTITRFYNNVILFGILILFISTIASAATEPVDLYRVGVQSQTDVDLLNKISAEPLLRLDDGYLVLIDAKQSNSFLNSQLRYNLVSKNIVRENLALDITRDFSNASKFPVVFRENNVIVLEVSPDDFSKDGEYTGLAPIKTKNIKFIYKKPLELRRDFAKDAIDLDSLISLTEQDSLVSWLEALQSFPPRVTGSQSDYDSRDWIFNKFIELGYDSVILDSFTYSGNNVQNIVAYKIGTTYPDHQIVVGGHKDAVSSSPGADDNGTGSIGVLEIARILKDIDTKMTFKFICFDGEEQGLHGAWHNADQAAANGDSIVCMLNMDMIGFQDNVNDVTIYHNSDPTFAELWIDLADSLTSIGLTGHLQGTSQYSDHYAYQQNGYDVVFAIEYIFNDWYHTYRDSTSYVDYSYAERIIRAMLATGYEINNAYVPTPGLLFTYPDGVPEFLTPGIPDTFMVHIEASSGGTLVPSTGMLYYTIEGQSQQFTVMTDLGGGDYRVILPAINCEFPSISFYISAQEATTGVINDPDPSNPYIAFAATDIITAFEDDFETDKGWTISGGLWARGTPTGGGGQYGNPDPSSAHGGANEYGYNLNGDYENSLVERHLTSPAIDCSELQNAELKFWRWLGVEQPSYDHAYIRISVDGSIWTTIWANDDTIEDDAWTEQSYDISSIVDGQAIIYIRFTMGATDGSWQYCGWNIDDLSITGYSCNESTIQISTESIPDWTEGHPLSIQLEAINGIGKLGWADMYEDLNGTGLSLNNSGLLSGTPTTAGTISFTAEVTDESKGSAIKPFSFVINPSLAIATTSLPDWTAGVPYSQQLTSNGGTGTINWTDLNDDLVSTGLAISSEGLISGTPLTSGTIAFTAQAIDQIGAIDTKPYEIEITSSYTCGDIDDNDAINILDITSLISFLYKEGDAPDPIESGDVNNSGEVNILDITYLISFLYKEGPAPNCP